MIITISREFGSGGRELGKRLAEALGIACYDNEIITMLARDSGMDEEYIRGISEKNIQSVYATTIGRRLSMTSSPALKQAISVVSEQRRIIELLAKQGDCVIVGRCADEILKDYHPMNLFVYADQQAKLHRCIQRAPEGEHLSQAQLERKMKQIDRERARLHDLFAENSWGDKAGYHLCINTTGVQIKDLIPALTAYVRAWFSMCNG